MGKPKSRSGSKSQKVSVSKRRMIKTLLSMGGVVLVFSFFILDKYSVPFWDEITNFFSDLINQEEVVAVSREEQVSVHYLDIGQGDASLILTPTTSVLIDSGEKEQSSKILSYLKDQNVKKLDYVIVSHPHSDHFGGMADVINEMDVGKVIVPKIPDRIVPTTKTYARFLQSVKDNNLKLTQAVPGTEYDLGDGAVIKIFAPLSDEDDDLNNYSVVFKLTHGRNKFLFTGDAEKSEEKDMLDSGVDLRADVLKIGHHGSTTSTQKSFLNAVSPDYSVISCGVGNSFGHPHKEIISRLTEAEIEICRTDLKGTIIFTSNKQSIKLVA